jgi:hypothetical protein
MGVSTLVCAGSRRCVIDCMKTLQYPCVVKHRVEQTSEREVLQHDVFYRM